MPIYLSTKLNENFNTNIKMSYGSIYCNFIKLSHKQSCYIIQVYPFLDQDANVLLTI